MSLSLPSSSARARPRNMTLWNPLPHRFMHTTDNSNNHNNTTNNNDNDNSNKRNNVSTDVNNSNGRHPCSPSSSDSLNDLAHSSSSSSSSLSTDSDSDHDNKITPVIVADTSHYTDAVSDDETDTPSWWPWSSGNEGSVAINAAKERMKAFSSATERTKKAQLRAQSRQNKQFRLYQFGKRGEFSPSSLSWRELRNIYKLHGHDFIALDEHRHTFPTIVARQRCILVCHDNVKVLISPYKMFLFHAQKRMLMAVASDISDYFQQTWDDSADEDVGFELKALEAALMAVLLKYGRRKNLFDPVVHSLVLKLASIDDFSQQNVELRKLMPIKDSLTSFYQTVRSMRKRLRDLLSDDEEMSEFLISEKSKKKRHLHHEQAELAFENAYRYASDLQRDTMTLISKIDSAIDIATVNMNTARNRLLSLNVQMTMGTLAFAFGSCCVGAFGMNLVSGLETHPTAFYVALGGISSSALILYLSLNRYAPRQSKEDYSRLRDIQATQSMLVKMDDIAFVLSHDEDGRRGVDKKEFTQILQSTTRHPVDPREVDLIYRVFDTDDDGYLQNFSTKGQETGGSKNWTQH